MILKVVHASQIEDIKKKKTDLALRNRVYLKNQSYLNVVSIKKLTMETSSRIFLHTNMHSH